MDKMVDSYSGFFDNDHRKATGLGDYLKGQGIDELAMMGLATDYCVKFTALDAERIGYDSTVIVDASRPVGDGAAAVEVLRAAGVEIVPAINVLGSATP